MNLPMSFPSACEQTSKAPMSSVPLPSLPGAIATVRVTAPVTFAPAPPAPPLPAEPPLPPAPLLPALLPPAPLLPALPPVPPLPLVLLPPLPPVPAVLLPPPPPEPALAAEPAGPSSSSSSIGQAANESEVARARAKAARVRGVRRAKKEVERVIVMPSEIGPRGEAHEGGFGQGGGRIGPGEGAAGATPTAPRWRPGSRGIRRAGRRGDARRGRSSGRRPREHSGPG